MKKHHSVQEILRIRREVEKNGENVQQICRKNNINAGNMKEWN